MNLSSEDNLRLNVLIANAEAVRIDESAMAVFGLQGDRELKVQLNPNCKSEKYLGYVRELLSTVVLDSPGGYPVFLRRWTRMGQIDNDRLDRLLRLGEPEAVMAVVCSPGLTDELARRAWWCAPNAEHARRMLDNPHIVQGPMGPVLAEYLIEYLPFETEHCDILESVRLILQPGLIDDPRRRRLWEAGRNKKTYRVAFLNATPDTLFDSAAARADLDSHRQALATLSASGNAPAGLLLKVLDSQGQTFMEVAADALRRPADQDVVSALLNSLGSYFGVAGAATQRPRDAGTAEAMAAALLASPAAAVAQILNSCPDLRAEVEAMLFLAQVDETMVTPIFAHSNAVGTVMRTKIEPVVAPILKRFAVLQGRGG